MYPDTRKEQRKFSFFPGSLLQYFLFCNSEEPFVLTNLEMYIVRIIIEHIIKTVYSRFEMNYSLVVQQDQGHQIHHEDPRRE